MDKVKGLDESISLKSVTLSNPESEVQSAKMNQNRATDQRYRKVYKRKKQCALTKLIRRKDDIITLILYEMKQENGSFIAIEKDQKFKDYKNSKVVN